MTVLAQKIEELAQELVAEGLLTQDQLAVAKESQKNLGKELRDILIQRGFVQEGDLIRKLAKKHNIVFISLSQYTPEPTALKKITPKQAYRWKMIPLFEIEEKVTVAVDDPFNIAAQDEARTELDKEIDCVLATPMEMKQALQQYYGKTDGEVATNDSVEIIKTRANTEKKGASPIASLEKEAQAEKVIGTVNQLLQQAHAERASDIHLEPTRHAFKIRFRIDGVLEPIQELPNTLHQAIISRIKILGEMDVAERRIPQEGRVRLKISGTELDLRLATYPTLFGEAAAIRLLSKDQLIHIEDLGFMEWDRKTFESIIYKPHGIFLATGPTGSGKTTTLYAALQKINREDQHVLSIEDPVEHEIDGVNQIQINPKSGITFASVLRSMLRQDPDIIMIGEIRDPETADIALRAAMTGHMVISTLHTNTAIGAIHRLIDLGVESYLISSTLLGVLAQRLVRRICPHCKTEVEIPDPQRASLGPKGEKLKKAFHGAGCRQCRMTGFRGRVGLFELMYIDEELRVLINTRAPEVRLKERLATTGSRSILEDGVSKIEAGVTTLDEVLKTVMT